MNAGTRPELRALVSRTAKGADRVSPDLSRSRLARTARQPSRIVKASAATPAAAAQNPTSAIPAAFHDDSREPPRARCDSKRLSSFFAYEYMGKSAPPPPLMAQKRVSPSATMNKRVRTPGLA